VPLIDPSDIELSTLRVLGEFAGRRVLEIGAGDGRLSWPLAADAALWLAVDNDHDELRVAAEDLRASPLEPVRLLETDGQALALGPECFDTALFTWSLCCVPRDGMRAALAEAGRVLRPGGQLLDVHPIPEPMRLEAWMALKPGVSRNTPDPRHYRRVPLGAFGADETLGDFSTASAAVEGAGPTFELEQRATFDYPYFFDDLDALTEYLEDNDELELAGDELLERALLALSDATTPAWLVLIQPVVASSLRKR
jgi:SAM-dependent methyltransferase